MTLLQNVSKALRSAANAVGLGLSYLAAAVVGVVAGCFLGVCAAIALTLVVVQLVAMIVAKNSGCVLMFLVAWYMNGYGHPRVAEAIVLATTVWLCVKAVAWASDPKNITITINKKS